MSDSGLPALELRIQEGSGVRRLPLQSPSLEFLVDQTPWSVTFADGGLMFRRGDAVLLGDLGQEVVLGEHARARVVDLDLLPPFWLISLSPDLPHQSWPVLHGVCTIGRPGKRSNTISLGHRSISRAHACITVEGGKAILKSESPAFTAVNNQAVAFESTVELQPNDVLRFGDYLLRWEQEGDAAGPDDQAYLTIKALGRTLVSLDGRDVRWRHEHAKDLFFWLAAHKDNELPAALVMDEYWPQLPAAKKVENLGQVLHHMRTDLGLSQQRFDRLILRTSKSLRLSTTPIADCDFWALRQGLANQTLEDRHLEFGQLFLPRNERAWARAVRLELVLAWLGLLQKATLPESRREQVLNDVTEILREMDFEDSVQEAAFALADALDASSQAASWLKEAVEHAYGITHAL